MVGMLIAAGACAAHAQIPSFVELRVPKPPTVAVNDSGAVLVYELHVTNLTAAPIRIRRVDVLNDGGGVIHSLADSAALIAATARPGLPPRAPDPLSIGGGLGAVVYMWVHVDGSQPPRTIRDRIELTRGPADSIHETFTSLPVPVTPRAIAIRPPLPGQWLAANGPSNTSGHRRLVMALDGALASAQRFAIDFLKVDSLGRSHVGDATKNSSYYAYGTPVTAVADGIVAEIKDGIPENVPGGRAVPIDLVTVAGNHIVLDLGGQKYALFAHLQPGSLRVRVGDRVKAGQVIALLGNSGNSTEPHLHFHITDALASGTSTLGSEGVPYALPWFDVVGNCAVTNTIACSKAPARHVTGGMPMQNQIVDFGQP